MSGARMLTRTQIENATTEELERMRTRIEAELEGRREDGERDHQSALEVLENHGIETAATSARAARGTARTCIGSTIATASAIASTSRLRRRAP
jgi:vacuolar-type H+-ATPase subunit E/Vma4